MSERIHQRNVIRPLSEFFLGAGLIALPWCLGGAPGWSHWVLLGVSAATTLTFLYGALRHQRRWVVHPVLWPFAAIAAVTLFQLVPLPHFLLGLLSPAAAEARDFVVAPLGLDRWRPISLDPPSTLRAFALALAHLGLVFTALQLGRNDGARRRMYSAIAAVGLSVIITGFGHLIAGEDELFGLYRFYGNVPLLTPFGNTNHLAGFLTLCTVVALGLAVDTKERENLVGWSFGALAMGVGVFLSMSRGGIGTFVTTVVLAGAVVGARRLGGFKAVAPWVVITATVSFAGVLALEQLVERAHSVSTVEKLQTTKMEMWPNFASTAAQFARAGMGRRAFELGYTRYQVEQPDVTFTHPENILFQWLCEVGVPFTLLVFGLFAWVGRRLWKDSDGKLLERLALVAVAGVVLHDVFDFVLELNAAMPLAAVCLGLVAGGGIGKTGGPARGTGVKQPVTQRLLGGAIVLTAVAFFTLWRGTPTHRDAEVQLAEAVRAATKVEAVRPLALQLIDRHPNDWLLFANMSHLIALKGDPRDALAWANRLLFLRPADARAHVDAGRALLRLGQRNQGLGEFRLAFQLGDFSALELALAVAAKEGDYERLLLDRRGFVTQAFNSLRARGRNEEALKLLDRALAESAVDEVRLEAQVLVATVSAQSGDPKKALELLDVLPEAERAKTGILLLRCQALVRLERRPEAIDLLEKRLVAEPTNFDVATTLIELDVAAGRLPQAREVIARVRPFATDPGVRINLFVRESGLWEADGRLGKAVDTAQSASRIEPNRADLHYLVARLFEKMGSTSSALDEVRKGRLVDSPEGSAAQDDWVKRLESQDHASLPVPEAPQSP